MWKNKRIKGWKDMTRIVQTTDSCILCPNCRRFGPDENYGIYCLKMMKCIFDSLIDVEQPRDIPDWCPLPILNYENL